MSTRATLTVFKSNPDRKQSGLKIAQGSECFHIYRHHDGYPDGPHGVVQSIARACEIAWPAGFEVGDFSAALVAVMKTTGGSVFLTTEADAHGDREFHYDITHTESALRVAVQQAYVNPVSTKKVMRDRFTGTLEEAIEHFDAQPGTDEDDLPDPWKALAKAEHALADIETARRKGTLADARQTVFAAMDAWRTQTKS